MPRQSRAGKIAGPQVQTATRPRTVTESCPSKSGVDPLHFQGDVLFKNLKRFVVWSSSAPLDGWPLRPIDRSGGPINGGEYHFRLMSTSGALTFAHARRAGKKPR